MSIDVCFIWTKMTSLQDAAKTFVSHCTHTSTIYLVSTIIKFHSAQLRSKILSFRHSIIPYSPCTREKRTTWPVETPGGKSERFLSQMEVRVVNFFAGRLVAGEKQHGRDGGIRCHSRILSGSFYPFARSKSCGRRVHLFVTWPASWTSRRGRRQWRGPNTT